MAKSKFNVPVTSAANCFVDATGDFRPVFRKTWDEKFLPTGVEVKVDVDRQLNGVPFRFETVSPADAQKALARVKELIPDVIAEIGPGVWVQNLGVPAIGTVGSEVFVFLGDKLLALAPQWILLENSPSKPHLVGPTGEDIQRLFSQIHPGRWNEVLR
jgi:hypothetical protein